jgi:hypothetical protein
VRPCSKQECFRLPLEEAFCCMNFVNLELDLCSSSSRKKVEIYFSWCNKKHCRRRRILEAACLLKRRKRPATSTTSWGLDLSCFARIVYYIYVYSLLMNSLLRAVTSEIPKRSRW